MEVSFFIDLSNWKKNFFRPKICVQVLSIFFKIRCWRRNYINGGKATKSSKAPHQNFQGNKMANFFAERQFICQRIIYEIPRLRTKKVTGLLQSLQHTYILLSFQFANWTTNNKEKKRKLCNVPCTQNQEIMYVFQFKKRHLESYFSFKFYLTKFFQNSNCLLTFYHFMYHIVVLPQAEDL